MKNNSTIGLISLMPFVLGNKLSESKISGLFVLEEITSTLLKLSPILLSNFQSFPLTNSSSNETHLGW